MNTNIAIINTVQSIKTLMFGAWLVYITFGRALLMNLNRLLRFPCIQFILFFFFPFGNYVSSFVVSLFCVCLSPFSAGASFVVLNFDLVLLHSTNYYIVKWFSCFINFTFSSLIVFMAIFYCCHPLMHSLMYSLMYSLLWFSFVKSVPIFMTINFMWFPSMPQFDWWRVTETKNLHSFHNPFNFCFSISINGHHFEFHQINYFYELKLRISCAAID